MVKFLPPEFIMGMKGLVLDVEKQLLTVHAISEGIMKYDLPTLTFNVLPDHVHMILAVKSEKELASKIGNIKGYSSHFLRKQYDIKTSIWSQKFHRSWLNEPAHFERALVYVDMNHIKHTPSWSEHFLCGYLTDFEKERNKVCSSLEEILVKES